MKKMMEGYMEFERGEGEEEKENLEVKRIWEKMEREERMRERGLK